MITDKTRSLMSNNGSHASLTYISSWAENYLSWLRNNQLRRLFVKYEDLITNKYETFRDIIVFTNTLMNRVEGVDNQNYKKLLRLQILMFLKKKKSVRILMDQKVVLKVGENFIQKMKICFLTLALKIIGKKS